MSATVTAAASSPLEQLRPRMERVESVDVLRGLIMVIMAIDHVRDYFSNYIGNPTGPATTWPLMYFTRWITHLCAPTFVFLAGASIYLQMQRKPRAELSRLLLTRGVWLMFLDVIVMNFVMQFNWSPHVLFSVVLFVIGASMIIMAGLIYLPYWVVAAFGWILVIGHNLLDPIDPDKMSPLVGGLWHVLHVPGLVVPPSTGNFWLVIYPLIPWPGVMALGFCFGKLLQAPARDRARSMLQIGLSAVAAFVALRALNVYGNLFPWSRQSSAGRTLMSFLNVNKYPPSLDFLLVTLGLSLCLMALFERAHAAGKLNALRGILQVYGKVPFFYYILHFTLAHVFTLLTAAALGKDWRWYIQLAPKGFLQPAPGYGFNLAVVYLVWFLLIVVCYVPCKWYAGVKARSTNQLLSYL